METMKERFLRYVSVNTRSDETSTTVPSTTSQVEFAYGLVKDLKELGLSQVRFNEANGFVLGCLPGNTKDAPAIGFIAHMDTAAYNAIGINPRVIENYDGKDILLNKALQIYSRVDDFPNLKEYVGKTLIVTDGTTLLGGDDKAGIVEIMEALRILGEHPEIERGDVWVAFGPDEEIGVGADKFDVEDFDVDFAYTMDGGPLGELQYETFSAAAAKVDFLGRNVHPGSAKDQMINAFQLAIDFHNALPEEDRPEKTEGYQGFFHLMNMEGSVDIASTSYIIRDFEEKDFKARKQLMLDIAEEMNANFDTPRVIVHLHDQYYNMKKIIEKDMTPINIAKEVMENLGIKPLIEPVRGGTDGSKISFMGIPTPNIFAGGENMHGRYEFVSLQTMEKAVDVILGIVSKP